MNAKEWYNAGLKAYYKGHFIEAKNAFLESIQLDDTDSKAWHGLGTVCDNLKEYPEAIHAYKKATHLNEKFYLPWNGLGNLYQNLKEYRKAIQAYKKAIHLNETSPHPWNGLGNVYKAQREYKKAIQVYQKAIELDKNFAHPQNGLGNVYKAQQEYKKAIHSYQKAIDLNPNFVFPWNGLGNAYREQQEYRKATQAYQKAIELDEKNSISWNGLGAVYYDLKEYPKAIQAYKKAIHLNENYAGPWHNLGILYMERKDFKTAERCYKRSVFLGHDPKPLLDFLGERWSTAPSLVHDLHFIDLGGHDFDSSTYTKENLKAYQRFQDYHNHQTLVNGVETLRDYLAEYYLGNRFKAFRLTNELENLQALYYGLASFIEFSDDEKGDDVMKIIEPYARKVFEEIQGGNKPSKQDAFYAGLILHHDQEPDDARICFEAVMHECPKSAACAYVLGNEAALPFLNQAVQNGFLPVYSSHHPSFDETDSELLQNFVDWQEIRGFASTKWRSLTTVLGHPEWVIKPMLPLWEVFTLNNADKSKMEASAFQHGWYQEIQKLKEQITPEQMVALEVHIDDYGGKVQDFWMDLQKTELPAKERLAGKINDFDFGKAVYERTIFQLFIGEKLDARDAFFLSVYVAYRSKAVFLSEKQKNILEGGIEMAIPSGIVAFLKSIGADISIIAAATTVAAGKFASKLLFANLTTKIVDDFPQWLLWTDKPMSYYDFSKKFDSWWKESFANLGAEKFEKKYGIRNFTKIFGEA